MTTYTVNYCDPLTQAEAPIGQIIYGDRGQLTFVSAIPSHEEYLRTLVERINKLPQLSERTDPSPDAPRYTITTRKVRREDEDFRAFLKDYLRRYYCLSLTTTEPEGPTDGVTPSEKRARTEPTIPQQPPPSPRPAVPANPLMVETPELAPAAPSGSKVPSLSATASPVAAAPAAEEDDEMAESADPAPPVEREDVEPPPLK
jgi:hypothetical protein